MAVSVAEGPAKHSPFRSGPAIVCPQQGVKERPVKRHRGGAARSELKKPLDGFFNGLLALPPTRAVLAPANRYPRKGGDGILVNENLGAGIAPANRLGDALGQVMRRLQ